MVLTVLLFSFSQTPMSFQIEKKLGDEIYDYQVALISDSTVLTTQFEEKRQNWILTIFKIGNKDASLVATDEIKVSNKDAGYQSTKIKISQNKDLLILTQDKSNKLNVIFLENEKFGKGSLTYESKTRIEGFAIRDDSKEIAVFEKQEKGGLIRYLEIVKDQLLTKATSQVGDFSGALDAIEYIGNKLVLFEREKLSVIDKGVNAKNLFSKDFPSRIYRFLFNIELKHNLISKNGEIFSYYKTVINDKIILLRLIFTDKYLLTQDSISKNKKGGLIIDYLKYFDGEFMVEVCQNPNIRSQFLVFENRLANKETKLTFPLDFEIKSVERCGDLFAVLISHTVVESTRRNMKLILMKISS